MSNRVPIHVRLESFEGPLDLLLYLIQSHEMDISRISISRITDQYLSYVRLMHEMDFDVASEFLVLAATLLLWKSKSILPVEGEGTDSDALNPDLGPTPEDLIRQLLEHRRFLAAGEELAKIPRLNEDVFKRPNKKAPIHKIWKEMSVTDLALSYQDSLVRARRRKTVLKKETVSLNEKFEEFRQRLKIGEILPMLDLIADKKHRQEVVVTFLASLELARLKKLKVFQDETYSPIYLELLEMITQWELNLAVGFDAPGVKTEPAAEAEKEPSPAYSELQENP